MEDRYFYRYSDISYGEYHSLGLRLEVLKVVKETKCGYWLTFGFGGKDKFVLKYGWKRYAWPSKEEAFRSFRERKKRQVKILKAQLKRAEEALLLTPDKEESVGHPDFFIVKE